MRFPMVNYHTHTFRCRHAQGDVEDYVRAALAQSLTAIGFSDHTPLPDDRWKSIRMSLDELTGYCDEERRAAAAHPGIGIFAVGALVFLLAGMSASFEPLEIWSRVRWANGEWPGTGR